MNTYFDNNINISNTHKKEQKKRINNDNNVVHKNTKKKMKWKNNCNIRLFVAILGCVYYEKKKNFFKQTKIEGKKYKKKEIKVRILDWIKKKAFQSHKNKNRNLKKKKKMREQNQQQ